MMQFANSTWPFVAGCSTDVNFRPMFQSLQYSQKSLLVNCLSLYLRIVLGISKRVIMFCHKNLFIAAESIDESCSASIHLVKWSTVTIRNFFWAIARGNGPKMYIPQRSKGQGEDMGCLWCSKFVHEVGIPLACVAILNICFYVLEGHGSIAS